MFREGAGALRGGMFREGAGALRETVREGAGALREAVREGAGALREAVGFLVLLCFGCCWLLFRVLVLLVVVLRFSSSYGLMSRPQLDSSAGAVPFASPSHPKSLPSRRPWSRKCFIAWGALHAPSDLQNVHFRSG